MLLLAQAPLPPWCRCKRLGLETARSTSKHASCLLCLPPCSRAHAKLRELAACKAVTAAPLQPEQMQSARRTLGAPAPGRRLHQNRPRQRLQVLRPPARPALPPAPRRRTCRRRRQSRSQPAALGAPPAAPPRLRQGAGGREVGAVGGWQRQAEGSPPSLAERFSQQRRRNSAMANTLLEKTKARRSAPMYDRVTSSPAWMSRSARMTAAGGMGVDSMGQMRLQACRGSAGSETAPCWLAGCLRPTIAPRTAAVLVLLALERLGVGGTAVVAAAAAQRGQAGQAAGGRRGLG